jgi:hypothetical protein
LGLKVLGILKQKILMDGRFPSHKLLNWENFLDVEVDILEILYGEKL